MWAKIIIICVCAHVNVEVIIIPNELQFNRLDAYTYFIVTLTDAHETPHKLFKGFDLTYRYILTNNIVTNKSQVCRAYII